MTYRRKETAIHAALLYDAMVTRFGGSNVFMDVDMAPGVDFVERISEAVAECHVLIVVMGPTWATVKDKQGRPRLADPEDFVRLEVAAALERPEVTPIPVLVGGAKMPNPDDLPPEVRAITRRQALELGDQRWRDDVARLIVALDELLADSSSAPGSPAETSSPATPARTAPPQEAAPSALSQASPPTPAPGTPDAAPDPRSAPPLPVATTPAPKDKTAAVLLAVFAGLFTWLYTYRRDSRKFWLHLGLSVVTVGIWFIVAWIWAIIDVALRPAEWYDAFPNGA
jgi:TIR domain